MASGSADPIGIEKMDTKDCRKRLVEVEVLSRLFYFSKNKVHKVQEMNAKYKSKMFPSEEHLYFYQLFLCKVT